MAGVPPVRYVVTRCSTMSILLRFKAKIREKAGLTGKRKIFSAKLAKIID